MTNETEERKSKMSDQVCIIGFEHVEVMSKSEFIKRLNEEYYVDLKFFTEPPDNIDPNYWGEKYLVIVGGKIMAPKPVQRVTEWEI